MDKILDRDKYMNTLRKILNELDEPESVKKEIYAQIQKDIT